MWSSWWRYCLGHSKNFSDDDDDDTTIVHFSLVMLLTFASIFFSAKL